MPTALDLAANLTGASVTEAQEKTWFTAMRAALAEMGDPMGRAGAIQNLSLAFSVGSNALTANVKTRAGNTASSTDPASVSLRNATIATGDFHALNIVAALAFTISSGSTFGHTNAVAGDIFWYIIDNAGTPELAASTKYFGSQGIVSTTAEGGAGAADSATVMYSTTARSNVAFRCIGHTIDTQTTAGTWAAVPSTVELAPFDLDAIAQTLLSKTLTSPVINSATGIGQSISKIKSADESVTSSTTLQDDDDLQFPIGANEQWTATFYIRAGDAFSTTGAGIAIQVPSGAALLAKAFSISSNTTTVNAGESTTSDGLIVNSSITGTWNHITLSVGVLNGATPGTVKLRWAQTFSSGSALTFKKGSYMDARRAA